MKQFIKVKLNNHKWDIRFVPKELMPVNDAWGFTYFARKTVDIRNDLDKENTELTICHEIVHALLMSHGRGFQTKFTQEDVCEFVSWNIKEVMEVTAKIMKERYSD